MTKTLRSKALVTTSLVATAIVAVAGLTDTQIVHASENTVPHLDRDSLSAEQQEVVVNDNEFVSNILSTETAITVQNNEDIAKAVSDAIQTGKGAVVLDLGENPTLIAEYLQDDATISLTDVEKLGDGNSALVGGGTTFKTIDANGSGVIIFVPYYEETEEMIAVREQYITDVSVQLIAENHDNDVSKLFSAYDYIAKSAVYNANTNAVSSSPSALLLENGGVCEAYAYLYNRIARNLGFEANYVTGEVTSTDGLTGNEGHAWNKIKVNGEWYNSDVTWSNTSGDNPDSAETNIQYFLFSDAVAALTRTQNNEDVFGNALDTTYDELNKHGELAGGVTSKGVVVGVSKATGEVIVVDGETVTTIDNSGSGGESNRDIVGGTVVGDKVVLQYFEQGALKVGVVDASDIDNLTPETLHASIEEIKVIGNSHAEKITHFNRSSDVYKNADGEQVVDASLTIIKPVLSGNPSSTPIVAMEKEFTQLHDSSIESKIETILTDVVATVKKGDQEVLDAVAELEQQVASLRSTDTKTAYTGVGNQFKDFGSVLETLKSNGNLLESSDLDSIYADVLTSYVDTLAAELINQYQTHNDNLYAFYTLMDHTDITMVNGLFTSVQSLDLEKAVKEKYQQKVLNLVEGAKDQLYNFTEDGKYAYGFNQNGTVTVSTVTDILNSKMFGYDTTPLFIALGEYDAQATTTQDILSGLNTADLTTVATSKEAIKELDTAVQGYYHTAFDKKLDDLLVQNLYSAFYTGGKNKEQYDTEFVETTLPGYLDMFYTAEGKTAIQELVRKHKEVHANYIKSLPPVDTDTPVTPPVDTDTTGVHVTPVTPPVDTETPETPPVDTETPVTPVTPPVDTETPVTPPVDTETPETPVTPPVDTETPETPPVDTETPVTPVTPPVDTETPVTPVTPPVDTETPVTPVTPPVDTETHVTPVTPPVDTETPVTPVTPPVDTETHVTPVTPPPVDTKATVTPTADNDVVNNSTPITLDDIKVTGTVGVELSVENGAVVIKSDRLSNTVATTITIDAAKQSGVLKLRTVNGLETVPYTVKNGQIVVQLHKAGELVFVPEEPTDIKIIASTQAKESITKLLSRGILTADKNGEFNANAKMTRDSFINTLAKAMGINESTDNKFGDKTSSGWNTGYVNALAELGLVSLTNNAFNGDVYITRQQAFTFMGRLLESKGYKPKSTTLNGFKDANGVSDYAKSHIALLVELGAVSGSDGKLNPKDQITQGQIAKVMAVVLAELGYL